MQRVMQAKQMLDHLRACIVASYYGRVMHNAHRVSHCIVMYYYYICRFLYRSLVPRYFGGGGSSESVHRCFVLRSCDAQCTLGKSLYCDVLLLHMSISIPQPRT